MPDPSAFREAVAFVLDHEGGSSDDPDDPGEATNFGISFRFYKKISPAATKADILGLTREQAVEIYMKYFWLGPGCDKMPPALGFIAFDACVNQGNARAIMMLQRAMRLPVQTIDGVYGPATDKAAQKLYSPALLSEYSAQRGQAYGVAGGFRRYGLGWMRRLIEAHSYALGIYNSNDGRL